MGHYIIYIPGLGDRYDGFRKFLLFFWRIFGVRTELVPMQWYDGKDYDEKFARVETAIKDAQSKGYRVSLIGESAGASMAMNVFAHDTSPRRMISLCGVNNSTIPISSHIYKRSLAFKKSVSLLDNSQNKAQVRRVVSVTGFFDPRVSVEKNIIPGAKHIKVLSIGHLTTIILCLSLYSFVLIRAIKH